jgi:hypothetical protein
VRVSAENQVSERSNLPNDDNHRGRCLFSSAPCEPRLAAAAWVRLADAAQRAALQSGQLSYGGLDVYEGEPMVNPGYLGLQNVVLLPHLGSATVETRNAMGFLALDGIDAVLAGRTPVNVVSWTAFPIKRGAQWTGVEEAAGWWKCALRLRSSAAVLPGCWSIAPAITALPMSFRALKAEQQDIDVELSAASDVDTITWRARDDLCWVETRRQFMGGWTVEQAGYLRAPIWA